MKKIFLISGLIIILFFSNAFKLFNGGDNVSGLNYIKQNIISCDPDMGSPFTSHAASGEEIFTNNNRRAAGEMRNGDFYLKLETRAGNWYPETHDGDALNVYAFAEAGKSLQVPGPLIRVPEGTFINAEVHNTIPGSPLILHGFYSHPGNAKDSVTIPCGDTYKVRFKAGKAGTYFYWASDGNLKSPYNGLPFLNDSQLFGAFIVDPPNTKPDPAERIFMIGLWNDTTKGVYSNDHEELTLNGLTLSPLLRINARIHGVLNIAPQTFDVKLIATFFGSHYRSVFIITH